MRLVTWNGYRGTVAERLARLSPLEASVIALQECRRPRSSTAGVVWRGGIENQGVATAGRGLMVTEIPLPPQFPATVLPVLVSAPAPFILVNVWTLPTPTFEEYAVKAASISVASLGAELPTVLIGDFNASPAIRYQRKSAAAMLRRLRDEFGLVSAYHAHHRVEAGSERDATLFHQWKPDGRFHVDYCFVPEKWIDRIQDVRVGSFDDWQDSDHRPLTVDLQL
jgi:endonuclease/exonuclease/phosphatase (EEP) superfamily protein YafD